MIFFQNKLFDCICDTCEDSANKNSALTCSQCASGILDHPTWKCDSCENTMDREKAEKLIAHCHSQAEAMLQNPEYHDLTKFEKWLTEYGKKLHPGNLTMIRIKHSLCGFYGRFPGFTMNDLAINPKLMGRKVELITECLESINKIEPGISSVKGECNSVIVVLAVSRSQSVAVDF